ncbi:MAG: hypothetical protein ACRC62_25605, partial [Microcoleus sp.]
FGVTLVNSLSLPEAEVLIDTSVLCCNVAEQMILKQVQISWEVLAMPAIAIASSSIRNYCEGGRSIERLVPKSVSNYIAAHQLYRKTGLASPRK